MVHGGIATGCQNYGVVKIMTWSKRMVVGEIANGCQNYGAAKNYDLDQELWSPAKLSNYDQPQQFHRSWAKSNL